MEPGVALTLVESHTDELIVSNSLLVLCNGCIKDRDIAQTCLNALPRFTAGDEKRLEHHQEVLVRMFAACSSHSNMNYSNQTMELMVCILVRVACTVDENTVHYCVLALGHLTCEEHHARSIVASSIKQLVFFKQTQNLLALFSNVSVDFPSKKLGDTCSEKAAMDHSAAYCYANCVAAKCLKPRGIIVEEMLQSLNSAIQESGIDIVTVSKSAVIGPSPSLCWLTEHRDKSIREKARTQVLRFIQGDLLAMVERGCVPVLWQLKLDSIKQESKQEDDPMFIVNALDSLTERLTPTVHQLLLRTIQMEGNENLRGHVATALALLAPEILAQDADALESAIEMLETSEGRPGAVEFLQAIYAGMVDDLPAANMDVTQDFKGGWTEIRSLLEVHEVQGFSILLDKLDEIINEENSKDISQMLHKVCHQALRQRAKLK